MKSVFIFWLLFVLGKGGDFSLEIFKIIKKRRLLAKKLIKFEEYKNVETHDIQNNKKTEVFDQKVNKLRRIRKGLKSDQSNALS